MTVATYSELVSELELWLGRADLTARIPTFIRLFEAKMNRRLRSPDMEQTFSRTTIIGTDTYALNSASRALRSAYIEDDSTNVYSYKIVGESIVIDPVPTGEFTLVYTAYSVLSALDSGNPTNWLLDDHPDAYLAGTLAAAYAFERDEAAAGNYNAVLEGIIEEIKREGNEKRQPAGPLQMQPPVIE